MQFAGLQKLTLLDFPGLMACVLFTKGCNFRCGFCHNASLVTIPNDDILTEDEALKFLKQRRGVLEGIVITGGEPLLHSDIPQFFRKVRELGYKIKLDTNGTNPELLKFIVNEGLVDYVAMDIKSSPEEYHLAVGNCNFDLKAIEESKNFLLEGKVDYEFRTTVVRGIHSKESLIEAAKWISGAKNYYLQQFKDSGELICADNLSAFSKQQLEEFLEAVKPFVNMVNIRGI